MTIYIYVYIYIYIYTHSERKKEKERDVNGFSIELMGLNIFCFNTSH